MTQEQLNISITPFTSEIIGADSKFLFIKEQDHDDNWYVLKIKRSDFNKMIKLWIDIKADYCKRYGHFCGIFGNFLIKMTKHCGKINLLIAVEDETMIYKEVPLLLVLSFDDRCDMEHG
jgi:hypothetical protein